MEETATLIKSLVEKAEVYTLSSIELLKLKAIDKSSNMLSSILSTLVISVLFISILAMINIAVGLWIGKLIECSFCGFFIVAAFYFIVSVVLYGFRKQLLKRPLLNKIINKIRNENNV